MIERYQRHTLIDWFDQRKLQTARIIVVGAGAVGNEVLKNLALLGVGHVHIFDFDKIEVHNLSRCVLFGDSDIGRYKADVAAESCRRIDPNVHVRASTADFWDGLTLDELAEADAVVSCVDSFESRLLLNQLCLIVSTDLCDVGIDSRYVTVEMFPFSSDPMCACYECALPLTVYDAIQKRYSCGRLRKMAFEEDKIPTTAITSSVAGAVAVSVLLHRLGAHPQAPRGPVRYFQDTITLATTVSALEKNDACFACQAIDRRPLRARAKRRCRSNSVIPIAGEARGEIVLSEPVLIRGVCKLCGREQKFFESARRLTESVTLCSACGKQSIEPEFIQRLKYEELLAYAEQELPCKFVTYNSEGGQLIVEMED